jgi:hypothetical protein
MNSAIFDWDKLGKIIQAAATVVSTAIAIFALWRQQRQAERLKFLEADIGRTEFEHQTKFARLHEKRGEVIAEIYRRVVILELWLNHVVAETELPDEAFTSPQEFAESFDAVFGQISLNLQDLAAYFNLNRLYLSEDVCEKILHFHNAVLAKSDAIDGYFYERFKQMTEKEISEFYGKDLREKAYNVLQQIADGRRAVEDEFRALLGISGNNGSRDTKLREQSDLMWIPAPEIIDPIKTRQLEEK